MPRYLKQTDNYSCGIIAAMNLDRWRGKKALRKEFPVYCKKLQLHKHGVYRRHFSKWLGFRPTRLNWPKLKKHLLAGGSAAVLTARIHKHSGGHFYFIDMLSEDGNGVRCVNFYSGFSPIWIHWRWLCKLLTRSSVWRII